ncbi:MAG: hypothetical protein NTZ26_06495 [Candidatus Aminicenantes bacterium]|nr:hypothetical protein [Candidatus Aminicenantes bacterium]
MRSRQFLWSLGGLGLWSLACLFGNGVGAGIRTTAQEAVLAGRFDGPGWAIRLEAGRFGGADGALEIGPAGRAPKDSGASIGQVRLRESQGGRSTPFLRYDSLAPAIVENGGSAVFPAQRLGRWEVRRLVFSPGIGDMVRWLTTVRNPTAEALEGEMEFIADGLLRSGLELIGEAVENPSGLGLGNDAFGVGFREPGSGRAWVLVLAGRDGQSLPFVRKEGPASAAATGEAGAGESIERVVWRYPIRLAPGESAVWMQVWAGADDDQPAELRRRAADHPSKAWLATAGMSARDKGALANFGRETVPAADIPTIIIHTPVNNTVYKTPVELRVTILHPEWGSTGEHEARFWRWSDPGEADVPWSVTWSGPLTDHYLWLWNPAPQPDPWGGGDQLEGWAWRADVWTNGGASRIPPWEDVIRFAFDRNPPRAAVLAPAEGALLSVPSVTISFEGRDNFYVRDLSLAIDGRIVWTRTSVPPTLESRRERDNGDFEWALAGETIGRHVLTVNVADAAGWTAKAERIVEVTGITLDVHPQARLLVLPTGLQTLVTIRTAVSNPRGLGVGEYRISRRIGSEGEITTIAVLRAPNDGAGLIWLDRMRGEPQDLWYRVAAFSASGEKLGESPFVAALYR